MTTDSPLADNSTYSKFLALYTRDPQFNLLSQESKGGFNLVEQWKPLCNKLIMSIKETYGTDNVFSETIIPVDNMSDNSISSRWDDCDNIVVLEHIKQGENQVRGIVLAGYERDPSQLAEFHDFFSKLILCDSQVHFSVNPALYDQDLSVASAVADFFAATLKNTIHNDQWAHGGREYFINKVAYFTQRNLQIESVLPAFPCKSSNTEKVSAAQPDRGEELALRRLIDVARQIKSVYTPGLKVYIVSDGHVFSDCIGVDDDVVDTYTEELKHLYRSVAKSMQATEENLIGFVSLKDMFFNRDGTYTPQLVDQIELPHYTGTNICVDSEVSRKMMMAGCDTDAGKLKRDLEIADHPRLHLYRGFWRFMSEDLKLNSYCQKLSKNAFKKTVSKVAFEMIKRNDAYSNLVELMFPFHLRLSIHAHTNAGPKFGIKLLDPTHCKVIKSLDSSDEPCFEDLLHIPTPWHNSIVYIEGHDYYYMTKSKVVADAIKEGHYIGGWTPGNIEKGYGGHFTLSKTGGSSEN